MIQCSVLYDFASAITLYSLYIMSFTRFRLLPTGSRRPPRGQGRLDCVLRTDGIAITAVSAHLVAA